MASANAFFEAALNRSKPRKKGLGGLVGKYLHGGRPAVEVTRKFNPQVRQEIKDIRKGGGRQMLTGRKTRLGLEPEAGAAMSGGSLPPSLWKRARQKKTSVPR